MKIYARIEKSMVAEIFATDADIATLFNPLVTWVDVTAETDVRPGWIVERGGGFAPPPAPTAPAGAAVTLMSTASLQAQLASLQAQIAALGAASH